MGARWDQAPLQKRADHVAKRQALVKTIRAEGFGIAADKKPALNAEFTPTEARLLKVTRVDRR